MKSNIVFLILFLVSCNNAQHELPPSMKGYELYSWAKDGKWNFTLVTGTNRDKTYEEIVVSENIETDKWIKLSVLGVDELKRMLDRLPSGQVVSWVSRNPKFEWPPQSIIEEITAHCKSRELILQK